MTTTEADADALRLEQQVCFALAVAARRVIGVYRPLLEPMGLTHPQYLVMLALWEREPLSVRALGRLVSLEPATLSPLVKRLAAAGFVTRQRDPDDERVLRIALTPTGRALREQALAIPPAVRATLAMSADELGHLHTVLSDVITHTQHLDGDR